MSIRSIFNLYLAQPARLFTEIKNHTKTKNVPKSKWDESCGDYVRICGRMPLFWGHEVELFNCGCGRLYRFKLWSWLPAEFSDSLQSSLEKRGKYTQYLMVLLVVWDFYNSSFNDLDRTNYLNVCIKLCNKKIIIKHFEILTLNLSQIILTSNYYWQPFMIHCLNSDYFIFVFYK